MKNEGDKTDFKWFHDLDFNIAAFITQNFPASQIQKKSAKKWRETENPVTEFASLDTTIRLLNMHRNVAEIKTLQPDLWFF